MAVGLGVTDGKLTATCSQMTGRGGGELGGIGGGILAKAPALERPTVKVIVDSDRGIRRRGAAPPNSRFDGSRLGAIRWYWESELGLAPPKFPIALLVFVSRVSSRSGKA
jgi:hypothetical protein